MLKKSDEEIWIWHLHLKKCRFNGMNYKKYCDENNLSYKIFTNMMYRIYFRATAKPEEYQALVNDAREYMASGIGISKFCDQYGLDKVLVGDTVTHLKYKDVIDRMKKSSPEAAMKFVQVPQIFAPATLAKEPLTEVVKKQNDVELIISAGVKVVVSPEVGADKLIRIIELLKDL